MKRFMQWSSDAEINMTRSTGKWEHVFFAERINYSQSFLEIETPEDIKAEITQEGNCEITLYLECLFYRGKSESEYSWGYVPKPERIRLGFAGVDVNELVERAVKWLVDNTDHKQEPIAIPYHADKLPKIPIIARLKNVPHWEDNLEKSE